MRARAGISPRSVPVADADDIPERRFELILENARRLIDGREFVNVVDKSKWY